MGKHQKKLSLIILVLVLVVGLFFSLIGFITDYLWFKEMGYLSVFFKQLVTQLKVGIPTFVVITGLVYLYLGRLKKSYFSKIASSEATDVKKLTKTSVFLAALFGAFATVISVSQLWFEILKFANATGFDITDPLFKLDVSFYLFKLPFIQELAQIIIGVIIAFAILTFIYYTVLLSVRTPQIFEEAEPEEEPFKDPFAEEQQESGTGFDNVTDLCGKFGEAFTGKKAAPKKKTRKKDEK